MFDGELAPLFTLETGADVDWNDRLILLADGRVGLRSGQGLTPESDDGGTLRTVDCEKKDWGTAYTLPYRAGTVRPGRGGYLFFCDVGDALYGYATEAGELKKLLSWTDVNVNAELLAGKIDILDTAGLPVRQYGSSGILEDLLPYLESDPDLGRDALVPQVLDAAMTPQYQHDANGNLLLDENGQPVEVVGGVYLPDSGLEIPVRAIREDERQQFMELLSAIDTVYDRDESIWTIVKSEAAVFFAGDRTVDETAALIQSRAELYINEKK